MAGEFNTHGHIETERKQRVYESTGTKKEGKGVKITSSNKRQEAVKSYDNLYHERTWRIKEKLMYIWMRMM